MQPSRTFGAWLKQLRFASDLTQEAAAERIGCATQTLRAFESGIRRPSHAMAQRLADALAVPSDQRAAFLQMARQRLSQIDAPNASLLPSPDMPDLTTAAPLPRAYRPSVPSTVLIGRADELNDLCTRLIDPLCRLLTLVGPGGIGKTRLALQAATDLIDHDAFPDGVVWVPLASVTHAEQIPNRIISALGTTAIATLPLVDQVLTALQDRTLLLVLDNVEHLLKTAPFITRIIHEAPGVTLLITSRERLGLPDEWVYTLDGLPLPRHDRDARTAPSALLFLDRAQRIDHQFALTPENIQAVRRICQLVEGMPLGIELAATWVRVLSCSEIAAELERGLDLLTATGPTSDSRHTSLRAVFESSWQLLTPAEQTVLMQLAVFHGSASREAIVAVGEQIVSQPLLVLLASLVDKSLVRRTPTSTTTTRYGLHELVRQYAIEKLRADPIAFSAALNAHATFLPTGSTSSFLVCIVALCRRPCKPANRISITSVLPGSGVLTSAMLLVFTRWAMHSTGSMKWLAGFTKLPPALLKALQLFAPMRSNPMHQRHYNWLTGFNTCLLAGLCFATISRAAGLC
ncbi:MAG: XRE family transcriptional regulator [Chloroflexaceae bacterium]|nr:XRE family transcriptional regulator [Chloroflexaceae bacterium]